MNRINKWLSAGAVGIAAWLLASPRMQAAVSYYESFEAYASGSSLIGQGGWTQGSGSGNNAYLTVETNPSIAIDGNNYFRLEDLNPGVQQPLHVQSIDVGPDWIVQWFVNPQQTSGSGLSVGLAGNLGGALLANIFMSGSTAGFGYTSNTVTLYPSGANYAADEWYGVRLHVNAYAKAYDLRIFRASDNSDIINQAGIPFFHQQVITNFYIVSFTTDGAASGVFYLDDFSVSPVPEPTAGILIGVGGLALWARRRRS